MITSSTYELGPAQADGRRYVTEKHTNDDGKVYSYSYLADDGWDYDITLSTRATTINAELERRATAELEGQSATVPVSRVAFLRRLTTEERVACRELAKTDTIADDFLKILDAAETVDLYNPDTINGVNYMASKGCLTAVRADEVLNG